MVAEGQVVVPLETKETVNALASPAVAAPVTAGREAMATVAAKAVEVAAVVRGLLAAELLRKFTIFLEFNRRNLRRN